METYQIIIEDLEFETVIGILPVERIAPQKVVVDLKIHYRYDKNFINYAEVIEVITDFLQKEKFELIETALDRSMTILKEHYQEIDELYIKLQKPDIIKNAVVGVTLERRF